jgi:protein-L-isoaspartate(D-aspartate) O-methyltransferase
VHIGDGTKGYEPASPFDRIIVAASAPKVPEPLLDQLAEDGRLVLPVGSRFSQHLEIWDREGEKFRKSHSIPVVFVPLIGDAGWEE